MSVDSSNIAKNDIWHIKIRPYDGIDYGNWVVLDENITIRNTPPEALNVKILEESPVPNNSDLHVSYTYFDYDSDSQDTNLRQIYWYRLAQNGTEFILQTLLNDSMVVGNGNTSTFDYWIFKLYISDGENLSEEYTSASISINSIANTPPEARFLNMTPLIATTLSDIILNWTFYDEDGDNESGSMYYWYINGIHVSSYDGFQTIPSSATTKGDEIHVKVKPRDGKDFGTITSVSTNITITNTPPTVSNLVITPNNPITSNNLQLSYEWYDIDEIDEDTGTSTIWYLNGELQGDLNNSYVVVYSLTAKGQIWHCKVKPSDGTDFGDWVGLLNNITIRNSAPSASNLKITPNSPNTTSSLSVSFTFYDPDFDTEQNSYIIWYRNGLLMDNFTNSTFIPSINTSKGENWYYTIRPSDGESYGNLKTSPTITILNSAPTISDLEINPFLAQTQDILTINYTFNDIDNDMESGTEYIWYKNGILQGNLNDSPSISSGYTLKGQIWHCKVRPSDGQEFGPWINLSLNVTILNTRPSIDLVELFPFGEVYTTSSLTANFEASDINGDPIIDNYILWYKNGVLIPELENFTSVSSSYTYKGDNWNYTLQVFDGEDWSLPASPSEEIIILNSKPTISNVKLIGGFTTLQNITISYNFIDLDGDTESLTNSIINWRIFRQSGPIPGFIEGVPNVKSLDSSWIVAGDFIWVLITPSDGELAGSQVDSSDYPEGLRSVGNSAPFISGIPLILDQDGTEHFAVNSSLNAKYIAVDPDSNESKEIYDIEVDENGLVIGAEYHWYKNGVLNSTFVGSMVSSQYLISGDTWTLSVRPKDRYGDFGPWINSSTITIGNSRIAITDIWFTNLDDGKFLMNETFSNITLALSWDYFDADGDNQIDFEIHWYLDNGSGYFIIKPEFENETVINTALIQKGQIWYATIRSTDGIQWSSYANSSYLQIINSPPLISQIVYNFPSETLSNVLPSTRTNEFYVVDEDINISYIYYDYDFDESHTRIQWFKQLLNGSWVEIQLFENQTYIDQENTQAGEVWYAKITPSDGIDIGDPRNSSKISILSRPMIQNINYQPDTTMDVRYNLTVEVSDISSQDSIKVDFELIFPNNSSITLHGTALNKDHWNVTVDLLEYIDETISVKIKAFSEFNADGAIFKIFKFSTFNFTAVDESPPRLLDIELKKNNIKNPTSLTIFVQLEEYVSGITEVILYYYVTDSSTFPIGGGVGSTISEEYQIEMTAYNESGGIWWFWVSIPYNFGPDVEFHCAISAKDGLGNYKAIVGGDDYVERLVNPLTSNLDWTIIIITVIIILVLFLFSASSIILVKRYREKEKSKISSLEEKLAFLSDIYVIIVSTAAGVPIWTITSVFYQLDSSLSGSLSGISSGIDSFLDSFQADFMAQIRTEYSLQKDHPDFEKFFKVSVVEQEQVKIMILGSISYRIFVFLKEKPSNFLRETFLLTIKDMQAKLPIHDLGVINEEILAPNIQRIINRHLPIDLLKPFKINYGRITYFDNMLKKNIKESPISRNALNVLKLLAVAVSISSTQKKKKKTLLNIYDTKIANQTQRFSGNLLFLDALNMLQKLEGINLGDIYEAFWMGIDENVKILVPIPE